MSFLCLFSLCLCAFSSSPLSDTQVGWTALFDNGNNGSRPLWTINEAKTKKAPWIDMAVEVMNFKWNQVMDDTGKVVTEKVESTLTELAKRGLQGILTVSFHNGWSEVCFDTHTHTHTTFHAQGANKGFMPKYLFDMGNVTCKDFEGKVVGAYGREEMIAAIEKTAAGLGEVFNGDKRLFATEVGFVGHAGLWQQGVEENPDVTCPLPDQAATRRIITAVATAFKDTFVLMPRPWVAKEFPYANHPNMGLIDPNFYGEHTQLELQKLGLEERWKTAPVLARFNEALDKGGCWFDGHAAGSCQSVAKELPPFAEALAAVHPTSLQVNRLFYDNRDNVPLLEESKTAYMQTGAQLHLSGVALETYADTTMICASVTNIGSAPFYAPASAPLTLKAKVGAAGNTVEVAPAAAGKTMSMVMPNETAVFAVTVDFAPATDECAQYASVCTAEGQTYVQFSLTSSLPLPACPQVRRRQHVATLARRLVLRVPGHEVQGAWQACGVRLRDRLPARRRDLVRPHHPRAGRRQRVLLRLGRQLVQREHACEGVRVSHEGLRRRQDERRVRVVAIHDAGLPADRAADGHAQGQGAHGS